MKRIHLVDGYHPAFSLPHASFLVQMFRPLNILLTPPLPPSPPSHPGPILTIHHSWHPAQLSLPPLPLSYDALQSLQLSSAIINFPLAYGNHCERKTRVVR